MDLNEYWQENKRFVTSVAVGALVFLIAYLVVGGRYDGKITSKQGTLAKLERDLRQAHFTAADKSDAVEENDALLAAVESLSAGVAFRPRDGFRIDRTPGAPSAGTQYLRAMNDVSATLVPRAKRANMKLDEGLGMPALSPTRDDDIERYLDALDVIDTVANLAIDCGVERVTGINVRPDSGRSTRQGVGRIERTEIQFRFEGAAQPLVELLARTQRPRDGRALTVADVEMVASRFDPGDANLDLKIVAVRLHEAADEESVN